ncbi:MAG: HEAT repeat domain-containing protein [Candidatus Latescibacteria bacterium]|nr:HEAT repeat domain-containing protein [Candidatus Latescibacterota bacterium]
MDKQQLKEWIMLSLYDELSEHEEHELQSYLQANKSAQSQFDELEKLHAAIARADKPPTADVVLVEARHGLRAVMKYEQQRKPVMRRLRETISIWRDLMPTLRSANMKLALTGVSMLLVGVYLGMSGGLGERGELDTASEALGASNLLKQPDVEISNVRFLDADASDGTVEFVFEAIRPIQIRGTLDNPDIQRVLAHAVVNEQNPGVRLRAVNAVSTSQYGGGPIDEVKRALVVALKTDPNSGVRREAFSTLIQLPYDTIVKDALIHVLMNDDNVALRIEAINQLQNVSPDMIRSDQVMVDALQSRVDNDDNRYIRLRARNVLEEISNP